MLAFTAFWLFRSGFGTGQPTSGAAAAERHGNREVNG
jgi:hypothetical protein